VCCETGALMIVPPNALHALRNNRSQIGRLLGISTPLHQAFFDAVVAADKRRTFASLPLPEAMKLIAQIGTEHNMYFAPVDASTEISVGESPARQ
jgi:hypothetical protein